jgi:hypothetical protein
MTLREREILEIERGSTISHCVENLLWKRVWACFKRDFRINKYEIYNCCRGPHNRIWRAAVWRPMVDIIFSINIVKTAV